jgi:signal peptidase I
MSDSPVHPSNPLMPEHAEQPLAAEPLPGPPTVQHHHPVGILPAVQSLLYVTIVALFLTTFTVQPIRC